ncbi:hypothetical protein HMPREF9702_05776 [Delftia acidovorans CCUG 15835]|nr:hypothetical protein HMPREF9702_05776 [Delftia acidovorans CCUG 15835]
MPYFSVKAYAHMTLLIKADDADEAAQIAFEEASFHLATDTGVEPAVLLEAEEDIESCRRHADQVFNA